MKRLLALLLTSCMLVALPASAAQVAFPAQGFMMPHVIIVSPLLEDASSSAASMTAATHQIYVYGRIYQKDRAFRNGSVTKSISSISFPTQTVTCAACGTTLQIDYEGLSKTAGPPAQPDGVIASGGNAKGTVALTGVSQNAWVNGPTFTTPPPVHYGDEGVVVFSYSVFGSSGAFNLRANTGGVIGARNFGPNIGTFNGATYAIASGGAIPPIAINFTDGTVGTFSGAQPYSATTQLDTFNSGSNPNEYGLQFQTNFDFWMTHLCASGQISAAAASATLELTDNNSVPNQLSAIIRDGHVAQATGNINGNGCDAMPSAVFIHRDTTYNIGYLATSGSNVGLQSMLYGAASSKDAGFGTGIKFNYVTRHGGPWSAPTTTLLPPIGFIGGTIDDGSGPPKPLVYNGLGDLR